MSFDKPSAALKRLVVERACGCCEYCLTLRAFSASPFVVEHIIPEAESGPTVQENLCLSCQGCNGHKHSSTTGWDLVTEKSQPLFHPRQDRWAEHFAWNAERTTMIGLTPKGRATVHRLRLNRPELVNLRGILTKHGVHPPEYPYGGYP